MPRDFLDADLICVPLPIPAHVERLHPTAIPDIVKHANAHGICGEYGYPVRTDRMSPIKWLNRIGQVELERGCVMIKYIQVQRQDEQGAQLLGHLRPIGLHAPAVAAGLKSGELVMGMRGLVDLDCTLLRVVTWDVIAAATPAKEKHL